MVWQGEALPSWGDRRWILGLEAWERVGRGGQEWWAYQDQYNDRSMTIGCHAARIMHDRSLTGRIKGGREATLSLYVLGLEARPLGSGAMMPAGLRSWRGKAITSRWHTLRAFSPWGINRIILFTNGMPSGDDIASLRPEMSVIFLSSWNLVSLSSS